MLIFAALFCLVSLSDASSRRVFNGRRGDRNMFPYQVALTRHGSTFCGGTILDATHVLSAAHCFQTGAPASSYSVLIADNVQTGRNQQYIGRFASYVNHPQYRNQAAHDLTLITLSNPIPLNGRTIKALPISTSRSQDPNPGDEVVVSGFGQASMNGPMSPTLQWAGQIVTSQCFERESICTEARDRQGVHRSACRGDSGGPLEFGGRLVGAVSRGDNCVGKTSFARVSTDASWIQGFLSQQGQVRPVVQQRPPVQQQPPRVPSQLRPSPSFSPRGSCPNGVAPRAFYDSGCTASFQGRAPRVTCRIPPPMPLGSMPRDQQRQMQSFPSQALQTGDIRTCCLASTNIFYCRGPRTGFAPGTPGV